MFKLASVTLFVVSQLFSHITQSGYVCEEIVDETDCGSIPKCYWEEEPACEEEITTAPSSIPSNLPTYPEPTGVPSIVPTQEPTFPKSTIGSSDDTRTPTEAYLSLSFRISGTFNTSLFTTEDLISTVYNMELLSSYTDLFEIQVISISSTSIVMSISYSPALLRETGLPIDDIVALIEEEILNTYGDVDANLNSGGEEKSSFIEDVLSNDMMLFIIAILLLIILVLICCVFWFVCHCCWRKNKKDTKLKKVELQKIQSLNSTGSVSGLDSPIPFDTNDTSGAIAAANATKLLAAVSVSMDNMPTPLGSDPASPVTSGDELEVDGDEFGVTGGQYGAVTPIGAGQYGAPNNNNNNNYDGEGGGAAVPSHIPNETNNGGDLGESDSGDSSSENEMYATKGDVVTIKEDGISVVASDPGPKSEGVGVNVARKNGQSVVVTPIIAKGLGIHETVNPQ